MNVVVNTGIITSCLWNEKEVSISSSPLRFTFCFVETRDASKDAQYREHVIFKLGLIIYSILIWKCKSIHRFKRFFILRVTEWTKEVFLSRFKKYFQICNNFFVFSNLFKIYFFNQSSIFENILVDRWIALLTIWVAYITISMLWCFCFIYSIIITAWTHPFIEFRFTWDDCDNVYIDDNWWRWREIKACL